MTNNSIIGFARLEGLKLGSIVRLRRDVNGIGKAGSEHKVCWLPNGGYAVKMETDGDSLYRTSGSLYFRISDAAEFFEVLSTPLRIEIGGYVRLRRDILGVGKKGSIHKVIEDPSEAHLRPKYQPQASVRVFNPDNEKAAHLDPASIARGMVYHISGDGQSFEPVTGFCTVLDCRHCDGSVYSWYVSDDDATNYVTGCFVEVEHLGGHRNEYLPVAAVRIASENERPTCKVVGLANR